MFGLLTSIPAGAVASAAAPGGADSGSADSGSADSGADSGGAASGGAASGIRGQPSSSRGRLLAAQAGDHQPLEVGKASRLGRRGTRVPGGAGHDARLDKGQPVEVGGDLL